MTAAPAVTTAASKLLSGPSPRLFTVAFTPAKARVAYMRRITTTHLRYWRVPVDASEDIVVSVSELVTNALRYAPDDVVLTVRYADDELRIEVFDGNPAPARPREAAEDDESGRGLFLVALLAGDWGVSDDGKTTWAHFRIHAGRS
ncbi:ATP-binding protein [Streptomyces sp. SID13666]|uniref:ATP-binding protein n=1 Tax=unclassified Streptomyces TaxID=2593676 RepID=UPI0013BF1836|nr:MULTISPECIES: ATP-binding protein [unclassified Streptomyces]MCZ4098955.1 ATP-binding protein [Streptomyces sp. H39-C1]NEA60715.1 ATP-binding protein [Streptomyces sp. SID13666]